MGTAMTPRASVVIPTLNAGPELAQVLGAVRAQRIDGDVELLVCDSGSSDQTVAVARRHGARVLEIPASEFSHGATRNRLMAESGGAHVAFLTQDSMPAAPTWLARLLAAFALAPDVGLAFGPYVPRVDASPMVRRELAHWFGSLAPDAEPRIDRLGSGERTVAARDLLGARGYFTDANGCLSRVAWQRVPFREVAYAEDHLLAHDMLRAGYAKVYVPEAAVIHSHDYSLIGWLRRSFDEARATREVYGWTPAGEPRAAVRNLRGNVGADVRQAGGGSPSWTTSQRGRALAASLPHHAARTVGGLLGAHAGRLPGRLGAQLSLERRR